MEQIVDTALYQKRIKDQPLLNASLFGVWCIKTAVPGAPIVPLAKIWDNVERGALPDNTDAVVSIIVNLVARYHQTKDPIDVSIKRYGQPSEPAFTKSDNGFSLTRNALIYLETYVFACLWPKRLQSLISTMYYVIQAAPARAPDVVMTWLLSISMNMESCRLESGCRQIYCAAKVPTSVAIRSTKTSYEQYRDLNDVVPVPDFAEKIELVALNTPRDILAENLSKKDILAEASAIMSMTMLYSTNNCKIALKVKSNRDAGVEWCHPPAVFFTDTEVYICLREGRLVKPHTKRGTDIVFAFFAEAHEIFPDNDNVRMVLDRFCSAAVDPDMPEWAD
jgi:hypothetical protein